MKFTGFPARAQFTPVPDVFLTRLIPEMTGEEIRVMLAVFNLLYRKKGYPRYVTAGEVSAHPALSGSTGVVELLEHMTDKAALLELVVNLGGKEQKYYLLNNPEGQKAVAAAEKGELKLNGTSAVKAPSASAPLPDVFTLYEENIGLITPMVAEELKDALQTYPEQWVRDALKEAASLNKRNMRYIERILENWASKGKNHNGTYRPDNDPDKFIRGPYGKLVQR